jgi:hypothetical protein
MTRQQLERHQVWIYLGAILVGLALGSIAPGVSDAFEALLWPALLTLGIHSQRTRKRSLIDRARAYRADFGHHWMRTREAPE